VRPLVSRFPFMPWNDVGSQFLTLDHQGSRFFQPSFPTFYVMSHILIPFIKSHGIPGLVASIKRSACLVHTGEIGCWCQKTLSPLGCGSSRLAPLRIGHQGCIELANALWPRF
jgi:hypothetical protein